MIKKAVGIILIFLVGFFSSQLVGHLQITEKPFSVGVIGSPSAPSSITPRKNILVGDGQIIIKIKDASLSKYASSGSMLPVLSENTIGIKVPITNPEKQLNIGDIAVYRNKKSRELIVHRILDKGWDEKGLYFIFKGDNNLIADNIVYADQVLYRVVGFIY